MLPCVTTRQTGAYWAPAIEQLTCSVLLILVLHMSLSKCKVFKLISATLIKNSLIQLSKNRIKILSWNNSQNLLGLYQIHLITNVKQQFSTTESKYTFLDSKHFNQQNLFLPNLLNTMMGLPQAYLPLVLLEARRQVMYLLIGGFPRYYKVTYRKKDNS